MGEVNERLRDFIETRRKDLGLSPTKLAEASGLTLQGLAPIRRGEVRRYQERLTGPLCAALGWTADSIERILDGGDPGLAAEPVLAYEVADELAELRLRIEAQDERLAQLESHLDALLRFAPQIDLPDADLEVQAATEGLLATTISETREALGKTRPEQFAVAADAGGKRPLKSVERRANRPAPPPEQD